jgi:antitoxin VapB
VTAQVAELGARATVTLVAADERIAQFRHPVATNRRWQNTLLVGLCAERDGLVVAMSRMISAGRISSDLKTRTEAAAHVFGRLLSATREGTTGADLFGVAAAAYRDAGFPREEARHHQGGAIGYRSRDWIAHPASHDIVRDRQAFAWNPSITGTKVEDTALLMSGTIEVITSTKSWPTMTVEIDGARILAPGVLEV